MTTTPDPARFDGTVTPAQFAVIMDSRRGDSPSTRAARRVLVDGERPAAAAHAEGIKPRTFYKALAAYRLKHALTLAAYAPTLQAPAP